MLLLMPDWPDVSEHIGALTTLREGGFSQKPFDDGSSGGGMNLGAHVQDDVAHVRANRGRLRSILPAEPVWLTQVHGVHVIDAAEAGDAVEADASVTSEPGVVCAILSADCLPVLFHDSAAGVVGAAHAGWRGLAAGILEHTVEAMRSRGADDIHAWMGPAIGAQRFEVGGDVLSAFAARDAASSVAFVPSCAHEGKYVADIYQLARFRLANAGVTKVFGGGLCTVSDQRFYSYRRDKLTGRMASLIWLR